MKKITLLLFTMLIAVSANAQLSATPDSALQFDKTQTQAASLSGAFPIPADNFTITAWVKPDGAQTDFAGLVILQGTNTAGLAVDAANGLKVELDGSDGDGNPSYVLDTGLTLVDNVWAFVGMTVTPTELKVFHNSSVYTHPYNSTVAADPAGTLWVGRNRTSTSRIFNGLIDEVAIHNYNIAEATVLANRNTIKTQSDLDNPGNGVLAYYQFNELGDVAGKNLLPKTGWTIAASSEEAGGEGDTNGYATAVIDEDSNTFWHSCWSCPTNPTFPYTLLIDMQSSQTIDGVQFVQRQSATRGAEQIQVRISTDNATWTTEFQGNLANVLTDQNIDFASAKMARYVEVMIGSGYDTGGSTFVAMAEISPYNGTAGIPSLIEDFKNDYDLTISGGPVLVASSATLSVGSAEISHFKAYPNPINAGGELSFINIREKASFALYDITGKQAYSNTLNTEGKITLPELAKGLYLYTIKTDTQSSNGKLIIK